MKKLIFSLALLLFTTCAVAQVYVDLNFDFNKAFHVKDNNRTEVDVYGFDWDFEVGGIMENRVGVSATYGRFDNAKFRSWSLNLSYHPDWFRWIDMSVGAGIGKTEEKIKWGLYGERFKWEGVGRFNVRATMVIYFHPDSPVGFTLRTQGTERHDVAKGYIIENSIGLRYKF